MFPSATALKQQDALPATQAHRDLIEAFFVAMRADKNNLDSYWSRIREIPGLKLDEARITRFVDDQSRTMVSIQPGAAGRPDGFTLETVVTLSSYDINCLLLHGLYVGVSGWTDAYRRSLQRVCQSLLSPVSNVDPFSQRALQKAFPTYFLSNMLLVSLVSIQDWRQISGWHQEHWQLLFDEDVFGDMYCPSLFSRMVPHFRHLIVKENQLRRLIQLPSDWLSDEQRLPLWDAVKDRLGELVTNGHHLERFLSLSPGQLPDAQRQQLWDAVKDRLGEVIENGRQLRKLLSLCAIQLPDAWRQQLWDAIKDRLGEWITTEFAFRDLLSLHPPQLNDEQRQQLWDAVKDRLGEWVDGNNLYYLLELFPGQLNETQRQQLWDAVKDRLGELIENGRQLRKLLSLCAIQLPAPWRQQLWDAVKDHLGELIQDKQQLRSLLSLSLDDAQRLDSYNALKQSDWAVAEWNAHQSPPCPTTGHASVSSCNSSFFAGSSVGAHDEEEPAASRALSCRKITGMACRFL